MSSLPQSATLDVSVANHSYPIRIQAGLLASAGSLIAPYLKRQRLIIISDTAVWAAHGENLLTSLGRAEIETLVHIVPSGEASKSLGQFSQLCEDILAQGIERSDTLLAFGGGVVGDLAGYVAASLLRGIPFIQWPTTLLSQVDSSVGGKTGINSASGKNLIGAFYQPQAVLIDTDLLQTLSPREWRAGYAEVVKYGLIKDFEFFNWLEAHGPKPDDDPAQGLGRLVHAISTSCQTKANVVKADEKERSGERALLNLGHTFAHALEAAYGFDGRLIHGEAVSVGMVMAYELAQRLGTASGQETARVEACLRAAGLPTRVSDLPPLALDIDALIASMAKDKKAEAGNLVFVVPHGIGQASVRKDVSRGLIEQLLGNLLGR